VVHPLTQRYNMKRGLSRVFTLDGLRKSGKKSVKKGDASKLELTTVVQDMLRDIIHVERPTLGGLSRVKLTSTKLVVLAKSGKKGVTKGGTSK
jgi:hypothetical protein